MENCPNCGQSSNDNVAISSNGGNTLNAEPVQNLQTPISPMDNAPRPKSRKVLIATVVVVAVVVVAVIAATLMMSLNQASHVPINNGDYLTYVMNIDLGIGSGAMSGTLRIEISNLTSNNLTLTFTISIDTLMNQTFSQIVNYSGDDWATSSFGDSGGSSAESTMYLVGHETLTTVYGIKAVDHYTMNYTGYTYHFWAGSNGCPYKLYFVFDSGMIMTCTLSGTNIQGFK